VSELVTANDFTMLLSLNFAYFDFVKFTGCFLDFLCLEITPIVVLL